MSSLKSFTAEDAEDAKETRFYSLFLRVHRVLCGEISFL